MQCVGTQKWGPKGLWLLLWLGFMSKTGPGTSRSGLWLCSSIFTPSLPLSLSSFTQTTLSLPSPLCQVLCPWCHCSLLGILSAGVSAVFLSWCCCHTPQ